MNTLQYEDIFDRTIRLVGKEDYQKLKNAKICVFGLGGVGSHLVTSLARCGIDNFLLLDGDVVDQTNINRQAFAFLSTIGKKKTEIAKNYISQINPNCNCKTINAYITQSNFANIKDAVFDFKPDWIIDAIDTITIKLLMAQSFSSLDKCKYISAMGAANKLDATKLKISSIYKTKIDPLARVIRKEARSRQVPDFMVCYSEEVITVENSSKLRKTESENKILGSISYLPAAMGITIASHVINDILGK